MKKIFIKNIIIIFIFSILFITNVFCNSKIAIVGNSQAYYMAKAVNVDDDIHSIQRTNNAVGGSFIWSTDIEISTFPYRAYNYDDCILFFGTNEILNNYELVDYLDYFVKYTTSIHKYNPKIKIKVIEIPKIKGIKQWDNIINDWNDILHLYIDSIEYLEYIKLPKKPGFKDPIHLDDNTLIKIYNDAIKT